MSSRKTKTWAIQILKNQDWETVYTGGESDTRKQFRAMMLLSGTRRMIDDRGLSIAKMSLLAVEVSYE